MKQVTELNKFYGSFFKNASIVAVSPYLGACLWGARDYTSLNPASRHYDQLINERNRNMAFWCVTLTILPVLPIATMFTFAIALLASVVAALTIPVVYPVAAVLDCAFPERPQVGY